MMYLVLALAYIGSFIDLMLRVFVGSVVFMAVVTVATATPLLYDLLKPIVRLLS